jgi:hypothetical protein
VLESSTHFRLGFWPCSLWAFLKSALKQVDEHTMVGPLTVRRMPGCSVSDYFLEWLKDAACPCGYVCTSIEENHMHPKCQPLSKVDGVAAADDNHFHVLFTRGTQYEIEDPSCSSLLDGLFDYDAL